MSSRPPQATSTTATSISPPDRHPTRNSHASLASFTNASEASTTHHRRTRSATATRVTTDSPDLVTCPTAREPTSRSSPNASLRPSDFCPPNWRCETSCLPSWQCAWFSHPARPRIFGDRPEQTVAHRCRIGVWTSLHAAGAGRVTGIRSRQRLAHPPHERTAHMPDMTVTSVIDQFRGTHTCRTSAATRPSTAGVASTLPSTPSPQRRPLTRAGWIASRPPSRPARRRHWAGQHRCVLVGTAFELQ